MFKFETDVFNDKINGIENKYSNEILNFESQISIEDATKFWDKQFETNTDISMRDILNRREEEFSFDDFDIQSLNDIIKQFDDSSWQEMSKDEQIDSVHMAVERIAEKLGLNEIPKVEFFQDDPTNCGCFYSGLNILGINECEMADPKELLNTISHELRHAYQEQHSLNPETEMDYKYLTNLKNYISPLITNNGECILYTDYYNQLVEAEARAFANLFEREELDL